MARKSSLVVRAVIALALMALFFAAAIGAIVGLAWTGKVILSALVGIHGRGTIMVALAGLACFAAAAVVAWSVLPRRDRFEPPGPEVRRDEQRALFAEIQRIAGATGEKMPDHVYLVDDVNAFVAERGGFLGLGSRRVMGLGLPLLRALDVSELRAVIAHEFGHFYGGDTRLGPLVYKTRGAMVRTVVNLEEVGRQAAQVHDLLPVVFAAVRWPFKLLAMGFFRVSQAVSRAQEYSADGVAVRTEGSRALISGLKKSHAAAIMHGAYLRNELAPLVERGVLPPVGEGFSRLLGHEHMSKLLDEVVDHELRDGTVDPYDSHPPLRERVAAAEKLAHPGVARDTRPAIELVVDAERFETQAIRERIERRVQAVAWADVGRYWIDGWREQRGRNRRALGDLTVGTVPHTLKGLRAFAYTAHGAEADQAGDDMIRGWATGALGEAIALVLVDAGWELLCEPGAPFRFRGAQGELVEPFRELGELFDGQVTLAAWQERWQARGLAGTRLAP